MPLKDLQEAWMLRQLEQEVTILSRLNHDNVIRYIATFQAPQRVTRDTACRHGRAATCPPGRLGWLLYLPH